MTQITPAAPAGLDEQFPTNVMRLTKREEKNGKNIQVFHKFLQYGAPDLSHVSPDFPIPDSIVETIVTEGDISATIAEYRYDDPRLQYLQEALTQRIQGAARGRENSGSAPHSCWREIFEASAGSGGQYMKLLKEFREELLEFLQPIYSEPQQKAIIAYTVLATLAAAEPSRKARFYEILADYQASCDPDGKYASIYTSLESVADSALADIEF